MRTIFLMVAIIGMAIFSFAQERNQGKQEIKKDSNPAEHADIGKFSVIKKDLPKDTTGSKIHSIQKKPESSINQNNQGNFLAGPQKQEFRMPVARGGTDGFNMPVAVPDSTVEYYIKNKKIDYVNPREKSRK